MSLAQPSLPTSFPPSGTRKRTSSFCCSPSGTSSFTASARPAKAPRTGMGSLRRSESYLSIPDSQKKSSASTSTAVAPNRSLRDRERRRPTSTPPPPSASTSTPIYNTPLPKPPSAKVQEPPKQYALKPCTFRVSSPLSPVRTVLPGRPVFPRSKHEPDLYRKAITTRMRCTPEGQQILHMGPKLALSIMSATKELERIVAAQTPEPETDVMMSDGSAPSVLSTSWVVVPGEDWEMVDCGA